MFTSVSSYSELSQVILSSLHEFVSHPTSVTMYRTSEQYFSRKSLISFPNIVFLLLSNMSNSLSVELYNLLKINALSQFTKSAFSQRRYQLKADIFPALTALFVSLFYTKGKEHLQYWQGFILTAIDGSSLILPNTPSVKAEFGTHKNGTKHKKEAHETVMGRLLVHYDVLNHIITYAQLHPIAKSEQSIVYTWISTLLDNALTLFDRGFGSYLLFFLMQKYHKPFVIRLRLNFNTLVTQFVQSDQMDTILFFTNPKKVVLGDIIFAKNTQIQIRLVKVILPNGAIEVLATSLMDTIAYPTPIFAKLYHLRWGVETCFDRFKNKLLALCFTGHKAEAIYQEIYANVIIHNIHQLFVISAQIVVNQKLEQNNAIGKEYKHPQKINDNVTIGILKPQLFALFSNPQNEHNISSLILLFAKYTQPIRPNRNNKRYQSLAKRRNLITQINYRRAG